jgi:hypothetical protein
VQLAVKALREAELVLNAQRLFAEDEHCILVHAGTDALERLAVASIAKVDRADLGSEKGVKLTKRK